MDAVLEEKWLEVAYASAFIQFMHASIIQDGPAFYELNYDERPFISIAGCHRELNEIISSTKSDALKALFQNTKIHSVVGCFNSEDTGNTIGACFFYLNNELWIVANGFPINKYGSKNLWDLVYKKVLRLFDYFDCWGVETFSRFMDDFHMRLCSMILKNPKIEKLNFVGYSYGCLFVTQFSFVYELIFQYWNNPDQLTTDEKNFVQTFYTTISARIESLASKNFYLKMVHSARDKYKIDFIEAMYQVDRRVFGHRSINKIYNFACAAMLTRDSAEKYQDRLGDRLIHAKMQYDPIPDILSYSSWSGRHLGLLNARGAPRYVCGNALIILNPDWYTHEDYTKAMITCDLNHFKFDKSVNCVQNVSYFDFMMSVLVGSHGLGVEAAWGITILIFVMLVVLPLSLAVTFFYIAVKIKLFIILGLVFFWFATYIAIL